MSSRGPLAVLLVLTTACSTTTTHWRASFHTAEHLPEPGTAPFLEAHTPTGDLYVLSDWHYALDVRVLRGTGLLYDAQRQLRARGSFEIPLSSIAVFETIGAETAEIETDSAGKIVAIAAVSAAGAFLSLLVVAFVLSPPGT